MKKKTILIIGAKSDISSAVAKKYASKGYDLQLAARNIVELEPISNDLKIKYAIEASTYELNILNSENFSNFIDNLSTLPDIVLCAVGLLGSQCNDEKELKNSIQVMRTNYEAPALLLGEFANRFEVRKTGVIIGISSVAGERGRGSNYIYGSSKSGFTEYLSGLRNRLFKSNISVITILPGFVNTKMTKDLKLNKYLSAEPYEVADAIYSGYVKKKNIVYTRPIWKNIMLIIKIIPESIFKRLKL